MSGWSWEHFSDGARLVVLFAHEEAVAFNRDEVGVEHLVVGLLRQEGGLAARALRSLGLTEERARDELESVTPDEELSPDELSLTRAAGMALSHGLREALGRGQTYVATEHMLLGLVRDPDGEGARFLVATGVDAGRVRAAVLRLMESESASEREPVSGHGGLARAMREPWEAVFDAESLPRFTDAAKTVIGFAEEESRSLNDDEVDPEHLLLGLLRVSDGVAARVLGACEITIEPVRAKLEQRARSGPEAAEGKPPLSFLTRRALARAGANAQPGEAVDTEQILLGIIGVHESFGSRLLIDLGVYLERLREVVEQTSEAGRPPANAAELARTEPGLTLEQHVTLGYSQATQEARHIAQLQGKLHPNLDDLVEGALAVDEGWPTGKGARDRLLEGTWPLARALLRDRDETLDRPLDAGDLVLMLASTPAGIVATALSALGIDADALARAVERSRRAGARSELLWPADLVAQNDEQLAAKKRATELDNLAQPRDELHNQTMQAHSHVLQRRDQVLEALQSRLTSQ
jgi:Clp amino terminal domain, pathogenicity island component